MTNFTQNKSFEIVILDSLTLGDNIDFSIFNQFGKTTIYKTTSANEINDKISSAGIVVTNKVKIGKNELNKARNLKLICIAATGYNNIDLAAARKRGIVVANVKNYSTNTVAQNTFSLILALENSLIDYVKDTRAGAWSRSPIFTMINYPIVELWNKKIGIVGYGAIGKRVAEIANAFGMKILLGKRPGISYAEKERVEFEQLLSESDIISIHAPLSKNTENLFGLAEFEKMKSSAILINTARGGIVNEEDLYTALKNGMIRAAAIDVTENEPIESESKLTELNNLLITPHIAWASIESRQRLIEGIIKNIQKFFEGNVSDINLAS